MDMILKAEIMLFHMISAFNEACSAATVRESGKVGVCVVGLHHGSQQQTTSTTPTGSLRRRPSQQREYTPQSFSPLCNASWKPPLPFTSPCLLQRHGRQQTTFTKTIPRPAGLPGQSHTNSDLCTAKCHSLFDLDDAIYLMMLL